MRVDATASLFANYRAQTSSSPSAATMSRTNAVSTASSVSSDGTRGPGIQTTDFTHMTRSQMQDSAKALFDSGKIDLTQLGMLQMAGPLGKVGPKGEFVPFTDTERANIDSKPVDYIQLARDALDGIESRGGASDPMSGFTAWKGILSTLQSEQGRISGVNLSA